MEEGEDKLVWMQRRKGAEWRVSKKLKRRSKGGEGSTAQRGKGTAKEKQSGTSIERRSAAREGVVKRRSGEPSKC